MGHGWIPMTRLIALLPTIALLLGGCDASQSFAGDISPPPPPPPTTATQDLGGAWIGTDSDGNPLNVLSTDDGRFNMVVLTTGEQGVGNATATGNDISISYTFVAPLGSALFDGSESATCIGTGTIQERQSLSVNVDCATSLGGNFNVTADLTYDSIYDRDSSLATVAGSYTTTAGVIYTVAGDGGLFAQDQFNGCVINGQLSTIDTKYNLYNVSWNYANCQAPFDNFNGSVFNGFAMLNDGVAPEQIVFFVTGSIGGVPVSQAFSLDRT